MRYLSFSLIGVLALAGAGCNKSEPRANPANVMKQRVHTFIKRVKEEPTSAPRQAEVFLEQLQSARNTLDPANASIYDQLADKCKDLAKGSGSDVSKKLDEMVALENQLPGEINDNAPPGGGGGAEPKRAKRTGY